MAYFDRRQRKLAEERERQQQENLSGGDDRSSPSSDSVQEQGSPESEESSPSPSQSGQQRQPPTRPEGFVCAADDPTWQDFVSRNIMGDYDPERARREPAYHNAWVSCERLVNMNRGAAAAGNFIPTNPRLAALLEHRRLEVARERYEEEAARRQQQQQQQQQLQGGAVQHDNNIMMVDGASDAVSMAKIDKDIADAQRASDVVQGVYERAQKEVAAYNALPDDTLGLQMRQLDELEQDIIDDANREREEIFESKRYRSMSFLTSTNHTHTYSFDHSSSILVEPILENFKFDFNSDKPLDEQELEGCKRLRKYCLESVEAVKEERKARVEEAREAYQAQLQQEEEMRIQVRHFLVSSFFSIAIISVSNTQFHLYTL